MTLAILNTNSVLTMTSREIAALTGKHHFHVTNDIIKMLVELGEDATAFRVIYLDSMNREQYEYELNRELTDVLLTGYSAKLRRIVIARWHELEAKQPTPTELSRLDILTMAIESEKGRLVAIEQRDHAIATKAQIGSKREATAMATASKAVKEVARLKDQLGFSVRQATIMQVEDATGQDYDFLPLRRWCSANEVVAESVPDKRYPKGVKAWPAGAWAACYDVSLTALFGEAA